MEYDNRNSGAFFPLLNDVQPILSGKLDNDGVEKQHLLAKSTDRQGDPCIIVYQRVGTIYENKDANDVNKKPHYSGNIDTNKRLSCWRNEKDGNPYLRGTVSEKRDGNGQAPAPAQAQEVQPAEVPEIHF